MDCNKSDQIPAAWAAGDRIGALRKLQCPVFEIFFGGARGGGKTDGMLGEWASHAPILGLSSDLEAEQSYN
jgi:hypothetical protein